MHRDHLTIKAQHFRGIPINTPYRKFNDILLIIYNETSFGNSIITNDTLKLLGENSDSLFDALLNNLYYNFVFQELHNFLEDNQVELDFNKTCDLWVLTSPTYKYGASLIFNELIQEAIYRKIGDYYVIPSSIHELLIVSKNSVKATRLYELLNTSNRLILSQDEILSYSIYEYSKQTGLIVTEVCNEC